MKTCFSEVSGFYRNTTNLGVELWNLEENLNLLFCASFNLKKRKNENSTRNIECKSVQNLILWALNTSRKHNDFCFTQFSKSSPAVPAVVQRSVSEIERMSFWICHLLFFLAIITSKDNYLSLAIDLERKRYLSKCEKI